MGVSQQVVPTFPLAKIFDVAAVRRSLFSQQRELWGSSLMFERSPVGRMERMSSILTLRRSGCR